MSHGAHGQEIRRPSGTVMPPAVPRKKSISLWARQKGVTPHEPFEGSPGEEMTLSHSHDEDLVIMNPPLAFNLRDIFCRRKVVDANASALSESRSSATGLSTAVSPVIELATKTSIPHTLNSAKRRFRAREELCLMRPKSSSCPSKSWFLYPGIIGRETSENALIITKDSSMDAVHAEVTTVGDDYLVHDRGSTGGTFLCLSTVNRHHPQRDGFRLRVGETFFLGLTAKIVVNSIVTATQASQAVPINLRCNMERRLIDMAPLHDEVDSWSKDRKPSSKNKNVHFADSSPTISDGSPFIGNIYQRSKTNKRPTTYPPHAPIRLEVTVIVQDQGIEKTVDVPGKAVYLIGSSPKCDIHVPSDGVLGIHARIVFDGFFFVLQDLSFEENPKRKTRVALTQPTRIARGDCLLFGQCALFVVSASRAFDDHQSDMIDVVFRCHLLRPSKRKARSREKYAPIGYLYRSNDAFLFGKGRGCHAQLMTTTLCVEQFTIQLLHGMCTLTPQLTGINQGMYYLLGRDSMHHEETRKPDFVRYTSKALILAQGVVFRCGNSELEVVSVKLEDRTEVKARLDEIKEHASLLECLPFMKQIGRDKRAIENVAKLAHRLRLEPGDSVYEEGDQALFLFIVISGHITLRSQRYNMWMHSNGSTSRRSSGSGSSLVEHVPAGSFFGEVSLCEDRSEYVESAQVDVPCVVLAVNRSDLLGYFSHYMDIFTPHLSYEYHKDLLESLRLHVPWLKKVEYQDLRILASKVIMCVYNPGEMMVANGFFNVNSDTNRKTGLLMLRYGRAVRTWAGQENTSDQGPRMVPEGNAIAQETEDIWSVYEPALGLSTVTLSDRFSTLKAITRVECFFFDARYIEECYRRDKEERDGSTDRLDLPSARATPSLRRAPSARRSSYAALNKRERHSQIVATVARAHEDDDSTPLESAELEDSNDPALKWKRKKRHKKLLEKIILDTQRNTEILNALVLYVLSGANRGDIHIVRNVATIGDLGSGADIELNDRYVSSPQAVIEHRDSQYWLYDTCSKWGTYARLEDGVGTQMHPGDTLVAGEVEFTCLATYPDRNSRMTCCIQ